MEEDVLNKFKELEDRLSKLEKSKADPIKKFETRLTNYEHALDKLSSGLAETQVDFTDFKKVIYEYAFDKTTMLSSMEAMSEKTTTAAVQAAVEATRDDKQINNVDFLEEKSRELEDRISLLECGRKKLHNS